MKNLLYSMIKKYNEMSFTHNYIFGFSDRGNVYAVITDSSILPYVCKLDMASRGAGASVRFKPTKAQKELLKTLGVIHICSASYFEDLKKELKYNRGEIFEKLITEYFGQIWEKDNVPFTVAGDLKVDNKSYQIKYEKATFCNEKSLLSLKEKDDE